MFELSCCEGSVTLGDDAIQQLFERLFEPGRVVTPSVRTKAEHPAWPLPAHERTFLQGPGPMPFTSSTYAHVMFKAAFVAAVVWLSTVVQAQVATSVDPPAKQPPITILLPGGTPPKELPPPMSGPPCERTAVQPKNWMPGMASLRNRLFRPLRLLPRPDANRSADARRSLTTPSFWAPEGDMHVISAVGTALRAMRRPRTESGPFAT